MRSDRGGDAAGEATGWGKCAAVSGGAALTGPHACAALMSVEWAV